jgi:hypothetical protein
MGRADDAVRLSVAELRRVLPALRESEELRSKRLSWSRFRRLHQAIAQHRRVTRRAQQVPLERPPGHLSCWCRPDVPLSSSA